MESKRQSHVKYKKLSVQEITSEKISELVCGSILYWESGIYKHG